MEREKVVNTQEVEKKDDLIHSVDMEVEEMETMFIDGGTCGAMC